MICWNTAVKTWLNYWNLPIDQWFAAIFLFFRRMTGASIMIKYRPANQVLKWV